VVSEGSATPRKLRIEFEGAIYHLMSRGDRREPIFRDDQDRRCFLETPGEACAKTDWRVHALCLMANHFHLVVETPRANLVAGMKSFLGTYTVRSGRRARRGQSSLLTLAGGFGGFRHATQAAD
jgi:REP element-mobilizing transposase RayT